MLHIIKDLDGANENELMEAIASNSGHLSDTQARIEHLLGLSTVSVRPVYEPISEQAVTATVSQTDEAELQHECQLFMRQLNYLPNNDKFMDYLKDLIMLINYPDVERVLARTCAEYNKEIFSTNEMLESMKSVSTPEELSEFKREADEDAKRCHRISDALLHVMKSNATSYQFTKHN